MPSTAGPASWGGSPGSLKVRSLAWKYFLLQGALVVLWWSAIALAPGYRTWFVPAGMPQSVLIAFALPDLALLAAGSLASAWLLRSGEQGAIAAVWLTTGFSAYASLLCLSQSVLTDSAWLGPTLMLPSTLLTAVFALSVAPPRPSLFRVANPASTARHMWITGAQVVVFWGVLLFLLPPILAGLDGRLGLPVMNEPRARMAAVLVFVVCSGLGIWSGLVMSTRGEGTPLPLDSTRRLVLSGPYAYLRNPMATAGLGQGTAVALWLGSPVVLAYVLLGSLIWQYIARPLEEDDLEARFGDEFRAYRDAVPCWLPRTTPYPAGISAQVASTGAPR